MQLFHWLFQLRRPDIISHCRMVQNYETDAWEVNSCEKRWVILHRGRHTIQSLGQKWHLVALEEPRILYMPNANLVFQK